MTLLIQTPRLILCRLTHADIQDLTLLVSHPWVSMPAPEIGKSEEKVRKYIDLQNTYQLIELG